MSKNTTTEDLLRHLSSLRRDYSSSHRDYHFSCDIYHDDLKDQMVVRLSNFSDDMDGVKHFRGDQIHDLLLDAINYVNKRKSML